MSESYIQLPPDSTGKKLRTIAETIGPNVVHSKVVKISGEAVKISGEAVKTTELGYYSAPISGGVIANIVSGQVVLHTITINDRTSGYYMLVRDSCSGAVGTVIAMIFGASRVLPPTTLFFDCIMLSGIVVITSGATWHATVTYSRR